MTTRFNEGRDLAKTDVIIWDEASLIPKTALETVDTLHRDVTNGPIVSFGGKILPMVEEGTHQQIVDGCIRKFLFAVWVWYSGDIVAAVYGNVIDYNVIDVLSERAIIAPRMFHFAELNHRVI
ncbi:hypothetical protein OESDEN_10974 [Oesophagostomum dentatum]|uniref:ATP-dependent DNA helicase n=1 Tax=Oesophagostomum dentatum TaxID=61180 RepID=A0A0B1SZ89_OESDE|nr:hypothetical protein OESDEN_10974 [Oesophagostomum dentatum]